MVGNKPAKKMKNGQTYSETGPIRNEWMKEPTSDDFTYRKFWHQMEFSNTVSPANAKKVLNLLRNLEEQASVLPIIKLLAECK